MDFGKNRVQYNDFYWSFYRFDKFDTYFNQDGEAIARFTGENAAKKIQSLEEKLNHTLNKRLIFLVYNKYTDFRQSNIGLLTGKEEFNTGGVTKIRNNKVSLFFQGDHQLYLKEMKSSISEVIVLEMLYGSRLTDNFASSAMLNLPEWYVKGLTSYLSEDWSIETESHIKDGITNKRYTKFNRLSGNDAIYAGHSFWKYINDYYGSNAITDIIYLTRVNKSANSALYNVLGIPFKEVTKQWLEFYDNFFEKDKIETDSIKGKEILKKEKHNNYYKQARLSPNGEKIAYISNELGQYKIWIYDSKENKSKKILKHGYKIKQINDLSYPVINWHPTGEILTIITERKGGLKLIQYILKEDKFVERNLLYFDKILDFSYSDNGSSIVFSAVKNSKTDIYVFDIASSTNEQITNDLADDFNPQFAKNSSEIIFSSNRINDTIIPDSKSFNNQFDLFSYDYSFKSNVLKRLTNTNDQNETRAFQNTNHEYYYLNDKNGIRNLYYGKYDSTISFIDTAIHYRYFLNQRPLTNYQTNILEYHINDTKNKYVSTNLQNCSFQMREMELQNFNAEQYKELQNTKFKSDLNKLSQKEDSIAFQNQVDYTNSDSLKIFSKEENNVDVDHYIFEIEKPYFDYKYANTNVDTSKSLLQFPKIKIYQRTFYTDHVVSQIDFSFLNSTYQAFTGGAVYFNPGFNALLKIGAFDLLEDYKIVAGVRFSADFNSNEYLFSIENLKKKIDEQFVYHRQSFENTTDDFVSKTQTNKLIYLRTLPFNQINAIKGTLTLRHDRQTYLAINRNTLKEGDVHKLWAGIKFDYIFDNTISKGVNLYNGTRYKIFGEYYNQLNKTKSDLFIVGADFRHYQRIHRDLILATRFAASTSFGHNKLIYYLGGVDNWTNFSQTTPTFIPLNEIPINDEEYAYQAVATNLRGFPQNIRNGNSFALINTELRLPVIKYFSNYPMNSSFWANLQLVGFFDVGTAWSGLHPYSNENAYDTRVIDNKSIITTLDTERDPIVAGYGFGCRAMLLGYFARFDWAWGIENQQVNSGIFYFSLSLDF
ncbi:MAG: PD40 domain-containing protein [Bacteroidales bacterium]|nr:PD40 domain-containing protein [Bacteroidales bacterium]